MRLQFADFVLDTDRRVLDRLGLDYVVVDSGCCGMAGSFGFEDGHYDVSQAVGEQRLLPHVRAFRNTNGMPLMRLCKAAEAFPAPALAPS